MRKVLVVICVWGEVAGCTNPFAPALDKSNRTGAAIGDQRTIEGFFQTFRFAYLTRDTTLYGQLVADNFQFTFTNTYNQETWARDVEMRTTNGLFRNTELLDLQWNSIIFQSGNDDTTHAEVWRTFFLRFGFSAANTQELQGQARLILTRKRTTDAWQMTRWDDFTQ
jgi:alpha-D-ribose 1-methylphosphonate 5-phosphate C-P lyase